jgi:hypothetical protein
MTFIEYMGARMFGIKHGMYVFTGVSEHDRRIRDYTEWFEDRPGDQTEVNPEIKTSANVLESSGVEC